MDTVNKAILIGRLGIDVENFEGGSKFNIATNTYYKKNDETVKETSWHTVVCFGKLSDIVSSKLKKGDKVYCEGRIKYNKWQGKDNVTRVSVDIVADTVKF